MYTNTGSQLGALPKWLTPPRAVRDLVTNAARNAKVSIPTPAGPIEVPVSQLPAIASRAQLKVGSQPTADNPLERATAAVEERVPGGWLTVGAGVAALATIAFLVMHKRVRRNPRRRYRARHRRQRGRR